MLKVGLFAGDPVGDGQKRILILEPVTKRATPLYRLDDYQYRA